jgi:hypothetical protein
MSFTSSDLSNWLHFNFENKKNFENKEKLIEKMCLKHNVFKTDDLLLYNKNQKISDLYLNFTFSQQSSNVNKRNANNSFSNFQTENINNSLTIFNRWTINKSINWLNNNNNNKQFKFFIGCNYISANAINTIEFWQENGFSKTIIKYELNLAKSIGFNTVRVFLHHIPYFNDKKSFIYKMEEFLNIANELQIKTIFVLFDDCWNQNAFSGKQPMPKKFKHNSGNFFCLFCFILLCNIIK